MKALHVDLVSPFFPLKGGIARFSTALRATLLKQGHEVEAISFKRLYPRILLGGKGVYEPGVSREPGNGVLPILDLLNPLTWFSAARHIRRMQPDIMICAYWFGLLSPLYRLLRHVSGIKMIVLMHNFTSHERFFAEKKLRDLLMGSADGIVTLSEHVARQVENAYPDVPVRVLFHPVYSPPGLLLSRDAACSRLGIDPGRRVLLFFGYIRRYKGLDILVDAMPEVIRRHPGTQLVIAGEFYYGEKKFRERIEKLGIGEQVKIYPEFVSGERMPLFFSAADAVVLPYREASQSGVVQQAYGFGCPVIVSGKGGLPEAVREGETGVVVDPLGPGTLAEGICGFLSSRERIPYGENVEKYAREFSWEAFAGKFEDFAREVIS
ncbi:MAG: glycosyltransferase [Chlorobiales bacterium]|nr:glycosyltransferase [Chlorobiales bacterium]